MAGALLPVAGGLMLLGGLSQANAQRQAARAQSLAMQYNAQVAERNALIARQQAAADAAKLAREARLQTGRILAQAGGQGLDQTGTVLDLLQDSETQAELDVQTVKYKGELRAMGYEIEAGADRTAARSARARGEYAYGASLLGSAGRALSLFGPSIGSSLLTEED